MNGLPYYKRYPRDLIEGTIGMSFELKTTYSFILDLIYMQGGHLPDDSRYIAGQLSVSVRKWNKLRAELIEIGKLAVIGEFLTNYRALSELESLAKYQDKQRENGSKPKKNNNLPKPRLNHTEPEPEPDTDDGDDRARGACQDDLTDREKILEAMGHDRSGIAANGRVHGTEIDMAEARRWSELGLSLDQQIAVIREVVSKRPEKPPPNSFKFFRRPMQELAGALAEKPLQAQQRAAPAQPQYQTRPTIDVAAILANIPDGDKTP